VVFGFLDRMPTAAAGGCLGRDTVSKPVDTSCLAAFHHTRRTVLTAALLSGLATTTGLTGHSSDWFGDFPATQFETPVLATRPIHVPG
jgi:hypothetical protein